MVAKVLQEEEKNTFYLYVYFNKRRCCVIRKYIVLKRLYSSKKLYKYYGEGKIKYFNFLT